MHRDVKPANVMFTRDGRVKLTDFGVARIENSDITQLGTVVGTPAYMSPEQFLGERVDWRVDIYATGVVLYQLLTGERPYEGSVATIMHKVLYTDPPLPSNRSRLATPALDRIVARAMAKRREDRFDSAAAFDAALQQLAVVPALPPPRVPKPGARLIPSGRVELNRTRRRAPMLAGVPAWPCFWRRRPSARSGISASPDLCAPRRSGSRPYRTGRNRPCLRTRGRRPCPPSRQSRRRRLRPRQRRLMSRGRPCRLMLRLWRRRRPRRVPGRRPRRRCDRRRPRR